MKWSCQFIADWSHLVKGFKELSTDSIYSHNIKKKREQNNKNRV